MNYLNRAHQKQSEPRILTMQRKPVRITITVSHALHEILLSTSDSQGRSLSNLAAYLLETAATSERTGSGHGGQVAYSNK
jgi:hypothetical protein